MFILTLPVGHFADRYDRRRIAGLCQFVECLATAYLAWPGSSESMSSGGLLVVIALVGAARAFEGPSMQALMPSLVDTEHFPKAAAWSASATQLASIAGPALGGLLYAFGTPFAFGAASLLYLVSAVLVSLVGKRQSSSRREPVTVKSLFAGIEFIRTRPAILGAISMDLFAVLLGGATALLPIYAKDILKTGSMGLGALRSAPAVGALVASLVLARRPLRRAIGMKMFAAVTAFGLATILFALSRSFGLSLFALIMLGAADVVSVVVRQSLVQLWTPDEMRGRVSAVNSMFIGTSNQLGEFESGLTAAWFGTVPAAVVGGIGTLVVVALWIRLFPQLARTDTLDGI
jgi:hypothetical protein